MTPQELARRQRAARAAADRAVAGRLLNEYQAVWARIKPGVEQLANEIEAERAAGRTVTRHWLEQQVAGVEQQVQTQIGFVADLAARRSTDAQLDALTAGQTDARTLLLASLPPGAFTLALPVLPLEMMVGRTSVGTPLAAIFGTLAPDAAAAVRRELVAGVAFGRNPRVTARLVRDRLGGNMARALTIARTETLGVYRAAAHETYRANQDVVDGWIWTAALTRRTCPVCWAQHGSFHTLDEPLDSHPACRCVQAPATKPWAELGFPELGETRLRVTPGPELFAKLGAADQRLVLGPGKFRAYQAGGLRLTDLVERTHSPVWGPGLRERSLRDALGATFPSQPTD